MHRKNYQRSLDIKKVFRWLLLLLFGMFIVFVTLFRSNSFVLNKSNLLTVPWPEKVDFAGEMVPLHDFEVRERWEKYFLIALAQDYQNILYLKRAPKYFPYIEEELQKRGLPDDLKYIAVAESALISTSTSSASAAGIWQFIPSTGASYNLQINDDVDERRHYEKATIAALDYLEFVYGKFNNWTLTAASFNAGQNKIRQRLSEQKVDSFYDLYLNPETSGYLFRILAIKEIMEHPQDYGYDFRPDDMGFDWPDLKVEEVRQIEDLAQWAKERGTTYRSVKSLNPWILGRSLGEGEWKVKVEMGD